MRLRGIRLNASAIASSASLLRPISADAQQLTYNGAALLTSSTLGSTSAAHTYNDYGEPATYALDHSGTELYRVIYADLNIKDVAPQDLPK